MKSRLVIEWGSSVVADERGAAAPGAIALSRVGYVAAFCVMTAWTAVVGALAVWRHERFLSHLFDLGNMVQAVWSTANGHPLEITDGVTGEQTVRLASHVDPILALLAPLWWLNSSPATLIVVQAGALAAGAYPVLRLGLKHASSIQSAWLLAAWYLVFPWVLWNAFNDFHPATLAIPLLLYAIWFLDENHLGRFAVVSFLALLTGELIGLTVAGLGVWYAASRGRRREGVVIALAGVGWTTVCLAFVIPAFRNGDSSPFYGLFESVGGSPAGLIRTSLTDPGTVLGQMTSTADLRYVVLILLPTLFVALGSPLLLVVMAPQLAVNLLAEAQSTTLPMFQYVGALLPMVIAASIFTVGRLPKPLQPFTAVAMLAVAAAITVMKPPMPGADGFIYAASETPERERTLRAAVALVPEGAPVSVTNRVGAHLSDRRVVNLFPELSRADWAVIDTHDPWLFSSLGDDPRRFARLLRELTEDPEWRLVLAREGVRVYRRIG